MFQICLAKTEKICDHQFVNFWLDFIEISYQGHFSCVHWTRNHISADNVVLVYTGALIQCRIWDCHGRLFFTKILQRSEQHCNSANLNLALDKFHVDRWLSLSFLYLKSSASWRSLSRSILKPDCQVVWSHICLRQCSPSSNGNIILHAEVIYHLFRFVALNDTGESCTSELIRENFNEKF